MGLRTMEESSLLPGHEELRSTVDLLHRDGGVERDDRDMFGGLLGLADLTVEDVMVHRVKMRTIDADLPSMELVREVLASPHTRLPLWQGEPDNIIGLLHARDLLAAVTASGGDIAGLDMRTIMQKPWFVPLTTPLKEQLHEFLRRKTHFALVVDEYGVVMGLVTLEDILEEIVGDIHDEHDNALLGLRPQPDGSLNVDGALPIRDLNRAMDWHLPDEEATTLAGLVIHEAQYIPDAGQVFVFYGFRFEILRRVRNRITLVRITRETGVRARQGQQV
jgi:Mg2+/Co2+ transporter CorB